MDIKEKISLIFPDNANIPEQVRITQLLEQREYLVDGVLKQWAGPVKEVYSPVCISDKTGVNKKLIGFYPLQTEKEALEALDAAYRAYNNGRGEWPTMSVSGRISCMQNFIVKMKEKRDLTIKILMWEIGKSFKDSEKEFDRTVDYIAATIEALKDLDRKSSRFEIEEGIIAQIRRAPLGVVLCMGPYNYPLNETLTTLIPALIMGNTVLFKPPKIGVLLHRPLLEAFRDSFPKGVVNTVYGEGSVVISPLMASGKIDVLAFIGSCKVADVLKKQHPQPHRLRCILGLGAKNAAVILKDADLDLAVKETILGSLSYNGQRCTGLKILFVHSSIAQEFLTKFCSELSKLKFGMPWDKDVFITPLPEPNKTTWMTDYVDDALKYGAKIINEGGGLMNNTFFFPAVVYPVNDRMKLYHEEQFGPIVPVTSFEKIEEPLEYVIKSSYGQQLSVFGKDPDTIAALIDPLVNQVCRLNINCQCQRGPDSFPFTGRKDSAEGTLSVTDALRVFTIRTLVAAKENDINKSIITSITREQKSNFLSTDFIL